MKKIKILNKKENYCFQLEITEGEPDLLIQLEGKDRFGLPLDIFLADHKSPINLEQLNTILRDKIRNSTKYSGILNIFVEKDDKSENFLIKYFLSDLHLNLMSFKSSNEDLFWKGKEEKVKIKHRTYYKGGGLIIDETIIPLSWEDDGQFCFQPQNDEDLEIFLTKFLNKTL